MIKEIVNEIQYGKKQDPMKSPGIDSSFFKRALTPPPKGSTEVKFNF